MADTSRQELRWFWDLIESSGRNLGTLCGKLEQLSRHDLCRYQVVYDQKKSEINPHCWEECHPYLTDECSEDHSDDFAAWVVMQGLDFYDEVAAHPERIQRHLQMFIDYEDGRGHAELHWEEDVDRDEYRACQRADYIALAIFHSRFGGSLLEACYDDQGCPRVRTE